MSLQGPWKLEGWSAGDSQGWSITIPNQQARIDITDWSQDSERIARTIAKAPELLELVRGVVGLERRKLLKDKGARAWVGACQALLAELGELPERAEGTE